MTTFDWAMWGVGIVVCVLILCCAAVAAINFIAFACFDECPDEHEDTENARG